MDGYETFSERKRREEVGSDVTLYEYDQIPFTFLKQFLKIVEWTIDGRSSTSTTLVFRAGRPDRVGLNPPQIWAHIRDDVAFHLPEHSFPGSAEKSDWLKVALEQDSDTGYLLDLIDATLASLQRTLPALNRQDSDRRVSLSFSECIERINIAFQQRALGYKWSGGVLRRVDSEFLHSEVDEIALTLIQEVGFKQVENEFISAFRTLQQGDDPKAAINAANNAYESCMKQICDDRGWKFPDKAGASKLVEVLVVNQLLSPWSSEHLNALSAVLRSSVNSVRNNVSAHGKAEETGGPPEYLAAYAIHLAAANIVMLIEAFKKLPPKINQPADPA